MHFSATGTVGQKSPGVYGPFAPLLQQVFSKERNGALTRLRLRFWLHTSDVAYPLEVHDVERLAEGAGGSLILARLLHGDHLVRGAVHN